MKQEFSGTRISSNLDTQSSQLVIDEEYIPSSWSSYVKNQTLDKLATNEARKINEEFVHSIDFRITQFEGFLSRQNIFIDLEKSDYLEFESFVFAHIDTIKNSQSFMFWHSIMVDFALLVARYKEEKTDDISIVLPSYKKKEIYGSFVKVKVGEYEYPIFNIFVDWIDDAIATTSIIYRYVSLSLWVQRFIDRESPSQIIKPRRFSKTPLEHFTYPIQEENVLERYTNTQKSKHILKDYIQKRKTYFYSFCSYYNIQIDLVNYEYAEFEIFAILNMDFDEVTQSTMNSLWRSLFIDLALMIGQEFVDSNENFEWYKPKEKSYPILRKKDKKKKTFDIVQTLIDVGNEYANNRGPLRQPNTEFSMRGIILRGIRKMEDKLLKLGVDYLYPSDEIFCYNYYLGKSKKDWYFPRFSQMSTGE